MPNHRGLTLKKFVHAIPWDLFDRYFDQLKVETRPSGWAFINADAMEAFLNAPENAEASAIILEDFRRINDICAQGMNLVVRAYNRLELPFRQDAPAQEMAMRLFLDHKDAFQFAWTRYLLFGAASRLTFHRLETAPLRIGDDDVERFSAELTRWFASLAKGTCNVSHFADGDETVILISRGSYIRTVAYWQGDRITFTSFRPASEDVVVYDPKGSQLTIKAGLAKDREQYLRTFATCIASDPSLADDATRKQVFSLTPLQNGTFDFDGDPPITRIELLKVRLKLYSPGDPVIDVKSRDVLQTFARDLDGLSLKSGELTFAKFCFHIHPGGEKPVKVTFEVEPPSGTNLAQKRYADIIENYLVQQGVKLR